MADSQGIARRSVLKAAGASLATLGLGTAAGCGGDSSGGGTVTLRYAWWGADDRAEKINETIRLFEKKHPKIRIERDFQPYEDFWKKFNTQASGGNAPDVFQNAIGFLRKYDARNVLLDLSEQVDAGNLDMENFRAGMATYGEIDGKLLGVPVGSNTLALVIDKPVYEKAGIAPETGWTWDDYYAGLEKIHDGQGIAGDSGPYGIMYLYDLVLRQNGKAFFTEDGLGFTEDDLTRWWDAAYERVQSGLFAPPKKVIQIRPKSALAEGIAGSEFTWDNFTARYSAEGDSTYGLAPVPATDGKTGQYLGGLMLSASRRTKHPAEVATFIDFMVHDPEVGRIMGYDRGVLASTEQYEAFDPGDDPVNKTIADYEKQVAEAGVLEEITPHPSGADVAEAAFLRISDDFSLGKSSVEEAVEQFFGEAETALST